jgi:cobalt-zinc-cadmium efflux system membrane fusion protein
MHRLITLLTAALCAAAPAAEAPPRNEQTVVLDPVGIANLGIETVEVAEADFTTDVVVLGGIEHSCESHSVLSSRIPGRAIEVLFHQGEFVKAGEVIARIESRQPGNPPPVIDLKAPASGLIVRSDLHLGGPVEPEMELMEILDLTDVWVVARVPQHQAAFLAEGLVADVRIPALGAEKRPAKFLRLGTGTDPSKSTIEGVFTMPNPGNRLRPGMRAEISIATAKREGVVSIPRDALQGDRASRFVFIKDYELENAFVRIPVTTGESNAERVEILTGLLPGDEVVTRGAYGLAFAGKGSASLKEALDAAHGHPHNEDGTEMTAEEIAARAGGEHGHSHDHGSIFSNHLVLFLAIACGGLLLLLIASPFIFRAASKA